MNNHTKGALALLLAGFMYALQAIFPKYLSLFLGPYETITLRFVIAFLVVIVIALFTRDISLKKIQADKKSLVIYALAFPFSAILFTLAVFYTKVSLAIFSFYIANVLSSFIVGFFMFKEKLSQERVISLVLILAALFLFTNPFNGFSLDIGFGIGLLSGIVQTFAVTYQKNIKNLSLTTMAIFQTGASSLMGIVFIVLTRSKLHILSLPPTGIIVGLLYGVSFAAVSYLMVYGFRRAKLSVGTVMVSSELFFGPVLAFFIFSEKLSSFQIIGGVLTIIAIFFANRSHQN